MAETPEGPLGNQRRVLESEAQCTTVDAGAGTGKTTTMLLRIERLVDRGEDPGSILVLTFANEAAANIREAIGDRLDAETAAAIDVYTYHSWCYRLVSEYGYQLGRSPELEVVTDHRRRRLIESLLREEDYPFVHDETADRPLPAVLDAAEEFVGRMSREDLDPERVLETLPNERTLAVLLGITRTLEEAAQRRLTFDEPSLLYFSSSDHLETARERLVEYGKVVRIAQERLRDHGLAHPVATDVDAFLEALFSSVRATEGALSLEDTPTKHLPRVLYCNQIFGPTTARIEQTPAGRLWAYLSYLREARGYAHCYRDYRQALEGTDAIDFDQIVRDARRLIEDPATRADVVDRWSWVCCDEFQDTDETQFGLLTALAGGDDGPSLLAIGDTDQAIYGWRGTDPTGLARLGAAFEDHEAVELERNFRSTQPILDVANRCQYGPQSSKHLEAHRPREPDRTEVLTVDSDELPLETPEQVARMVTLLLNEAVPGVPRRTPGDVAVVVRTNEQARRVGEALADVQIPHTITGSPRGQVSPGLQTLLSCLRVVLDPDQDIHLRRVLVYRYRVPATDLATLHERTGSLFDALASVESSALEQPGRVQAARDHLEELRAVRAAAPLSTLLERLLAVTDLPWYLTPSEREELERVHRFTDLHEGEAVLTTLTEAFVDGLERSLSRGSGPDRGEKSADRIDVMTVHQAKGLEFDTVLVPFCSDEHWCVERDYAERSRPAMLAALLDDAVESPLRADLAVESVREEWRVFHVAITRAANHLVLFGSGYDYDGGDGLGVSTADRCLPASIEWSTAGRRMDLWSAVTAAVDTVAADHPGSVADVTATLSRTEPMRPGRITYYEDFGDRQVEPLETASALETVHQLGRLLRTGTLLPAADAGDVPGTGVGTPTGRHLSALTSDTIRFPVAAMAGADDLQPALHHSHSALATYERCPRKHYLDHVVRAFDDLADTGGAGSARVVGSLFHAVAEEAHLRGYDDRERWRAVARRQAIARNEEAHLEAVLACVDRYFAADCPLVAAPVHAWEELAAELPFTLEGIEGVRGAVVGYVDSVRRLPDGRLAVLDYKATTERIPPEAASQLRVYVTACERRFDAPIAAAGYVYVGAAGPATELFPTEKLPDWTSVTERLSSLDDPRYDEYRPGPHCRGCPHQSLGCAPAGLYEPGESE